MCARGSRRHIIFSRVPLSSNPEATPIPRHRAAMPSRPPPLVCDGWSVTTDQTRIDLRECRKFHDERGNVAFRLAESAFTLSGRIDLADPQGKEIGYVRQKQRSVCPFSGGLEATYCFGYKHTNKVDFVKAKG